MKIRNKASKFLLAAFVAVAILFDASYATAQKEVDPANVVKIENPDFEKNWSGWASVDPSATSKDARTGKKAVKLTGEGGAFTQIVRVQPKTDYVLSAFVKGSGIIGVSVNGEQIIVKVDSTAYKQGQVAFNSGKSESVFIYGRYSEAEGQFDDFSLVRVSKGKPKKWKKGKTPDQIIPSLTEWRLNIPLGTFGTDNTHIEKVKDRDRTSISIDGEYLIGFEYPPYYEVRGREVVFRGHCAGATTKGSKYPRCELRQLVGGGNNYWSVDQPQFLDVEMRVTHLPVVKPEVSIVQIHGPEDEPLRVQYSKKQGLHLVWNEVNREYFKDEVPYELGQKLHITVSVDKGFITCMVMNVNLGKSYTKSWKSSDATGYFKVGCYTQSTIYLNQIKTGKEGEPLDAYGEVTVSKLEVKTTY